MKISFKAVPIAAAIGAMAFSSAAMAHDPEQLGEPLSKPFGERFSFIANFQTGQNPFNKANTHLTSSDIAFWGDLAYVGDYGGFRIFDISKPTPKLVTDVRCYGPQGDPSVFDTDKNGKPDVLTLSVDSPLTGPQCGAGPAVKPAKSEQVPDPDYPAGTWEGLRVFDISNPRKVSQVAAVYQDCGSHTNTLLPNPGGKSMYVLNSSYPLGEGPTCGPEGTEADNAQRYGIAPRKKNHGTVQVIEIPFANPAAARELTELPVVYPGDEDGTYKPVTDQGITAPLDDFLGCHDLSVFPAKGIVGAACGEQAQVWTIDAKTGLPNTAKPKWTYDQENVDFWHSATFSWDGKVANFIDESFGDGCPTTTVKKGQSGAPGTTKRFETGNMYFFETQSGALLSEYRTEHRPGDGGLDPKDRERNAYCSSHLGIPVPARDRYLLVNAYYRGGSSVIDFTNPSKPKEIAYAAMSGTNTWSAYTYPRETKTSSTIPVYSNDGLSRNYGTSASPSYPEAAYGFMRFQADVGPTQLEGFNRLNPQLQERVIDTTTPAFRTDGKYRGRTTGTPVAKGTKNRTPRSFDK